MTASRARGSAPHSFLCLFFGIVAFLCAAGLESAAAQQNAPPEPAAPAPSAQPTPLAPPTPLLPFDPTRRQPQEIGSEGDRPAIQGIEIDTLAEIDPDSLGVLDAAAGGFGPKLWDGMDRSQVMRLVGRLPDRYGSAVLRGLARRLLLSRTDPPAPAPEAGGGGGDETARDPALLALRIDRLAAVGDNAGLARLLKIVPRRYDEEPIARARIDSAMLAGDVTEGCREVRSGMGLYFSLPYWQKALLYCQIVAGEAAQAQLGLALLKEQGQADDEAFQNFVAALSGAQVEIPPSFAATPLHFALLQERGHPLPAGTVEAAKLSLQVAMAQSPKTRPLLRVEAGEVALALGAVDQAVLAEAYDRLADSVQSGESTVEAVTPYGRAQLYRAMQRAAGSGTVSQIDGFLSENWNSDTDFRTAARVAAPYLGVQSPRPETLLLAKPAGRALFAIRGYERANAWLDLAQSVAAVDLEAAEAATALWPYWRLSGGVSAVPGGGLATWRDGQSEKDPASLDAKMALLGAALDALESVDLPPPGGAAAAAASDTPEPDLLAELASAAAAGRRGETLLLALIAVGDAKLFQVPPATLGRVLAALVAIDLEPEARALAIESALAARI